MKLRQKKSTDVGWKCREIAPAGAISFGENCFGPDRRLWRKKSPKESERGEGLDLPAGYDGKKVQKKAKEVKSWT